jgi:hypothetical protein
MHSRRRLPYPNADTRWSNLMTRTRQRPDRPKENRTRIALAALTGLITGVTRAITDWLLHHLGN